MRIAIDLSDPLSFQSGMEQTTLKAENESEFIQQSLESLAVSHQIEEWIKVPALKTKGLRRLLSLGANKVSQLMQIKPDVVLTDQPLQKKIDGTKFIFIGNGEYLPAKKRDLTFQISDGIVATSDLVKKELANTGIPQDKITTIYAAPSENDLWLDWHQKYSVKQQNSEGKEFFMARINIGPNTGWESLFKAFSIFKKWQQTEVQLLLSAAINEDYEKEFDDKLASYKYRSDVKLLDADRDFLEVLPAAYGLLIHHVDITGMDMLNSFKAGVPVITSNENLFHEMTSGCFLPADRNADETGRQIINLYRDEHLRDTLAEKGKETAKDFTWQNATQSWFNLISKFAG
jgi:glycosyltransferase involved in cell wall biosynthesis